MLAWTIYISFLGVLVLMLLPKGNASAARKVAMLAALAGFVVAVAGFVQASPEVKLGKFVNVADVNWVPSLGIHFHLAADGISLTLVVLTGLAAVAGILFSWNIEHRTKEFFAFYLALIGGVYGVFLSFDVFLLFVFYEIAIIPKYFIIAIWGSTRREYGAMKLALYSFVGSAMVLVGVIAAYVLAGAKTMGVVELARFPFPHSFQMWAFPLVFTGFGILAGLWPFHTWAPTGHVAAPTAASMLLAGVVMKLGAYGCLRVAMTLFPHGLDPWGFTVLGLGSWRDVLSLMAVVGIVYGAMVALVQKDLKFVIGYSSVSHMGFVTLGIFALNSQGLEGGILQMLNHGVSTGALFLAVGIIYERTHTRLIADYGGIAAKVPVYAAFLMIITLSSIGLPGTNGFIGEFTILLGAFLHYKPYAVIASLGIILGAGYMLWLYQRVAFGTVTNPHNEHLLDMNSREVVAALPLVALVFIIGLYPNAVFGVMHVSVANLLQHVNAKMQSAPALTQALGTLIGN